MKNLLFAIRPLAMDMISTLFFVVISAVTHNPLLATAVAVAAGAARVVYLTLKGQRVSAMQWMSLGLVVVFGAATLLTHNARFMMFKPTIIYILVGAAMLERGWMLPYLPPVARDRLGDSVMIRWGYVWAGVMFATAALNVGFALYASLNAWSSFIAIFPLASKLGLFAVQYLSIRYMAVRHIRAEQAVAQAKLQLAA